MYQKKCPHCKSPMKYVKDDNNSEVVNVSGTAICASSCSARGNGYWRCENQECGYVDFRLHAQD